MNQRLAKPDPAAHAAARTCWSGPPDEDRLLEDDFETPASDEPRHKPSAGFKAG